jgi:hypothetical protein
LLELVNLLDKITLESTVENFANFPVNLPELVNFLDKITVESTFENLAPPAAILVISRQMENTIYL